MMLFNDVNGTPSGEFLLTAMQHGFQPRGLAQLNAPALSQCSRHQLSDILISASPNVVKGVVAKLSVEGAENARCQILSNK